MPFLFTAVSSDCTALQVAQKTEWDLGSLLQEGILFVMLLYLDFLLGCSV